MEFLRFIYILLLGLFILVPVAFSVKRQDQFLLKLKYLFPAILFTGTIFIIWDMRFTELGIWNYNSDFVLGIFIKNIPIEKWIFFFAVPFFSVYIYESIKTKIIRWQKSNVFVAVSLGLLVVFGLTAYIFRKNLYPFFTFFLLAIYFGYTIFRNKFKKNLPGFYFSFLIAITPFLILRGIVTSLPALIINTNHILNIHIFTIPIEDLGYFFLLHLMNITIFEYLKERPLY